MAKVLIPWFVQPVSFRLGSQYVALARRAMPCYRTMRINSILSSQQGTARRGNVPYCDLALHFLYPNSAPTMKMKRSFILRKYADCIETFYITWYHNVNHMMSCDPYIITFFNSVLTISAVFVYIIITLNGSQHLIPHNRSLLFFAR